MPSRLNRSGWFRGVRRAWCRQDRLSRWLHRHQRTTQKSVSPSLPHTPTKRDRATLRRTLGWRRTFTDSSPASGSLFIHAPHYLVGSQAGHRHAPARPRYRARSKDKTVLTAVDKMRPSRQTAFSRSGCRGWRITKSKASHRKRATFIHKGGGLLPFGPQISFRPPGTTSIPNS